MQVKKIVVKLIMWTIRLLKGKCSTCIDAFFTRAYYYVLLVNASLFSLNNTLLIKWSRISSEILGILTIETS